MTTGVFGYVPEGEDTFLSLFSHRYDYIYASHPEPYDRPQWQTESRHPLSDRLFYQGAHLYGVRFGQQTRYCLLDIDAGSPYHPHQDPLAISRIVAALEPLGLVSYVACTSSYSQGLHLYFPFETAQHSWQLSVAVTALLQSQGLSCKPGQLEVFPNSKLYVLNGTPNLFNAHRLPLQAGSYLLNSQLEPVPGGKDTFVWQWSQCQQRNHVETKTIAQLIKQIKRRRHQVSERADKFVNDLTAEIEAGWTGKGQTNYLLGRITMRCYIFHHVLHGGLPLSGEALVREIVAISVALPGYREWCNHQHEIYQRAEDWARCIENSRYFPYGTQQGKYNAKKTNSPNSKKPQVTGDDLEVSWNQQRSQIAQHKIQAAMAELVTLGQLPQTATARFQKLLTYGIGGSTLYKYKPLWHPSLWKTPQTPQPSLEKGACAMATPAAVPHPPSLFPTEDRNPSQDKVLGSSEGALEGVAGRNYGQQHEPPDGRRAWRQLFAGLKQRQAEQKASRQAAAEVARSPQTAQQALAIRENQQLMAQRMQDYLRSGDPILMKEVLNWVTQQERYCLWQLSPEFPLDWEDVSFRDQRLEGFIEMFRALWILRWTSADMRESLQAQFGQTAIAGMSFADLQAWGQSLQQLMVEAARSPAS
ncbi:MAG: hypothetical protein F6K42_19700 [Leptolyngbya sp. SIO1D8]|nr:hypothetical protein [Leptolyngbya sp. SIO1D8]